MVTSDEEWGVAWATVTGRGATAGNGMDATLRFPGEAEAGLDGRPEPGTLVSIGVFVKPTTAVSGFVETRGRCPVGGESNVGLGALGRWEP